jgi:hypothetical protein
MGHESEEPRSMATEAPQTETFSSRRSELEEERQRWAEFFRAVCLVFSGAVFSLKSLAVSTGNPLCLIMGVGCMLCMYVAADHHRDRASQTGTLLSIKIRSRNETECRMRF